MLLSILGVAIALGTLLYANTRETEERITAGAQVSAGTFLVTSPGVLDLVDSTVKITLSTTGEEEIWWGIGKSFDVEAYVGKSAYVEVAGLATWQKLNTITHKGEADALKADEESFAGGTLALAEADLWVKSGKGKGKAVIEFTVPENSARSLIATTATGKAPEISMEWVRSTGDFPALRYGIIGLLLAVIGVYLLNRDIQNRDRIDYFRNREAYKQALREGNASAQTSVLPVYAGNLTEQEVVALAEEIKAEEGEGTDTDLDSAEETLEEQLIGAESANMEEVADNADVLPAHTAQMVVDDAEEVRVEEETLTGSENKSSWKSVWNFATQVSTSKVVPAGAEEKTEVTGAENVEPAEAELAAKVEQAATDFEGKQED